jgi:hypothetical protein
VAGCFHESRIRDHTCPGCLDFALNLKSEAQSLGNGLQYRGSDSMLEPWRRFTFYLQIGTGKRADERTRTADLISSYEFAPLRSSSSSCVRKSLLFGRFSMIRGCRFVRRVPARISPVAVRLKYVRTTRYRVPLRVRKSPDRKRRNISEVSTQGGCILLYVSFLLGTTRYGDVHPIRVTGAKGTLSPDPL